MMLAQPPDNVDRVGGLDLEGGAARIADVNDGVCIWIVELRTYQILRP